MASKNSITTLSPSGKRSVFASSELPKHYLVAIFCLTTNLFCSWSKLSVSFLFRKHHMNIKVHTNPSVLITIIIVSEQTSLTEQEMFCGLAVSAYMSCKLSCGAHAGDSALHNFLSSLHFLSQKKMAKEMI